MNCPYCGKEVHDQAVLCVHCGKSLTQKPEVASVSNSAASTLESAFEKLAKKVKTALALLLIRGVFALISSIFYVIVYIAEDSSLYDIYAVVTNIIPSISNIIYLICIVIAISGLSAFIIEIKKNKKA